MVQIVFVTEADVRNVSNLKIYSCVFFKFSKLRRKEAGTGRCSEKKKKKRNGFKLCQINSKKSAAFSLIMLHVVCYERLVSKQIKTLNQLLLNDK